MSRNGGTVPRAYVYAAREGKPFYQRRVDFRGTEATLAGLGPGRFKIYIGTHMGGMLAEPEVIEFDGKSEVTRRIGVNK